MFVIIAIFAALAIGLAAYELRDAAQERKRLRRVRTRYVYGDRQ